MLRLRALRDLEPEERVLLIARRHPLLLLRAALPALAFILASSLLAVGLKALGSPLLLPVLAVLALLTPPWLLWAWADWRADLLVLTDRRVLWVERTPFLREWRWEAPLSSMQNVAAISRGPVGRFLGCADLVLDTASRGVQRLHGMRRTHEAAGRIVEAQGYASRRSNRLRRLQTDMGLKPLKASSAVEPLEVMVWRRHLWVLLRSTAKPLALLVLGVPASGVLGTPHVAIVAGSLATLWAAWIVDDWRNDEIVSTADRIIQTRRSPLMLHEESVQASLDKVQDISYFIPSPLAHLLNYGTVSVLTAGEGEDFILSEMPKPRRISAELNHRLQVRRKRKERALMSEVESTVHNILDDYGLSPTHEH